MSYNSKLETKAQEKFEVFDPTFDAEQQPEFDDEHQAILDDLKNPLQEEQEQLVHEKRKKQLLINAAITCDDFLNENIERIQPQNFVELAHQKICKIITTLQQKYKAVPSFDAVSDQLVEMARNDNEKETFLTELDAIQNFKKPSAIEKKWLADELTVIDRKQRLINAALNVSPLIKNPKPTEKDYQAAVSNLLKASKPKTGYEFKPLTSAEFAQQKYEMKWLVKGIMVDGQPAIVGGPKKGGKTSILADMAISLGSGTRFLNRFPCAKKRVAIISGESGEGTLQETMNRIHRQKGILTSDVLWDFNLPKLANSHDMEILAQGLKDFGADVVIIDPLYLCLLSGSDVQASNLFDMGPLLLEINHIISELNCMLILIHHSRKNLQNPYGMMDLEDLAMAGIQEFARQWLLISRRERYQPNTTQKFWLNAGGSAGHGAMFGLNLDEGNLGAILDNDDLVIKSERIWQPSILTLDEIKDEKAAEKEEKEDRLTEQNQNAFMNVLATFDEPPSKTKMKDKLGWGQVKFNRVLDTLETGGMVFTEDGFAVAGAGGRQKAKLIKRVNQE